MELGIRTFSCTELSPTVPRRSIYLDFCDDASNGDHKDEKSGASDFCMTEVEKRVVKAVYEDDKAMLITLSKAIYDIASNVNFFNVPKATPELLNRCIASKLLRFCCECDSVECASALLNGEVNGILPLVNEADESGLTALHAAAASHASKCVELLLRKRARTDLRTKDGRRLLPVELSLLSTRMDVIWNPDDYTVEDLVVCLNEKNLNAVRLLSERTKELADVAFANAIGGKIVCLAALLIVAAEKLLETVLEIRDFDLASKEKITIYEAVIRKALILNIATSKDTEVGEKRKLLLSEIELLQLFGAVVHNVSDRKVMPALVLASQAGDEAVIKLLLRTSIDVNSADADGNTALHWSAKTSKGSCPRQMEILLLLLKHGARVNQQNRLGLTAVHIAADHGNLEALQALLSEDPDVINYKSIMKETPLFFAVKKDNVDCVELLLRWGANSEVFSLRKQRPVDLAKSQDMRFMLSPTNIKLMNHSSPVQLNRQASSQGNIVVSDACDKIGRLTDEDTTTERVHSSTKLMICKYFGTPGGCARGANCFYAHGESELRRGMHGKLQKHRVFVGGLPLSMDADSLRKVFQEQFGLVEDAVVIGSQSGNLTKSRGFGFVTFKHEKSVSAAVQAHFISIMGKLVEIKNIMPKSSLHSEVQKSEAPKQEVKELNAYDPPQEQTCTGNSTKESQSKNLSWADRLFNNHPQSYSAEPQPRNFSSKAETQAPGSSSVAEPKAIGSFSVNKVPAWLRTFMKWLPGFLRDASKRLNDAGYPLSSLKADFRATCGLELDHASLGYMKLSDFVKSLPKGICRMEQIIAGRNGPASHTVLLPDIRPPPSERFERPTVPHEQSCATSPVSKRDGGPQNTKAIQDDTSLNHADDGFMKMKTDEEISSDVSRVTPKQNCTVDPEYLQLPKPDTEQWLKKSIERPGDVHNEKGSEESIEVNKVKRQRRHVVLEALARKQCNKSMFFLREFDFYKNYLTSIAEAKCFACGQNNAVWANFPCQHLLWCNDCDLEAAQVASSFEHKCVICDMTVQETVWVRWNEYLERVLSVEQLRLFS